jgi:hypothetical protein
MEAREGYIDADLLQIFVQARIFERLNELRALNPG